MARGKFVRAAAGATRGRARTNVARMTGISSTSARGGFSRSAANTNAAAKYVPTLGNNRGFMGAKIKPNRTSTSISRPSPVAAAMNGKKISRIVAGGIIGGAAIGGFRNRSGRPVDRVSGRPTGVYGY